VHSLVINLFDKSAIFLVSGPDKLTKSELINYFLSSSLKKEQKCIYINTNKHYNKIVSLAARAKPEFKKKDLLHIIDVSALNYKHNNKRHISVLKSPKNLTKISKKLNELSDAKKILVDNISDFSLHGHGVAESLMDILSRSKRNGATIMVFADDLKDIAHFVNLEIMSDISVHADNGVIHAYGFAEKKFIDKEMKKHEFYQQHFYS